MNQTERLREPRTEVSKASRSPSFRCTFRPLQQPPQNHTSRIRRQVRLYTLSQLCLPRNQCRKFRSFQRSPAPIWRTALRRAYRDRVCRPYKVLYTNCQDTTRKRYTLPSPEWGGQAYFPPYKSYRQWAYQVPRN